MGGRGTVMQLVDLGGLGVNTPLPDYTPGQLREAEQIIVRWTLPVTREMIVEMWDPALVYSPPRPRPQRPPEPANTPGSFRRMYRLVREMGVELCR